MTNKQSYKPTTTQPRLIKTKLEDALMSGQDESVAHTGAHTESGGVFAFDCTDSLDLQKPCDPLSILAPGDIVQAPRLIRGVATGSEESVQIVHIVQAPRLIRGVATGSEESVQIVQATTSGWIVARLGLPGAKVRRATREGAERWIVEQPLRTFAMVQVVWLLTTRYGRRDGGCAMQSFLGSLGFQSSPCTRRFLYF